MNLSKEQLQRFFGSVKISGTGCWESPSDRMINGYARFSINNGKQLAHRLSFEYFHGEIPKGMVVMHSCDVRNCVNPAHLSLGTAYENTMDMWCKGRGHRKSGKTKNVLEATGKATATHCKRGHLREGNQMIRRTGSPTCIICKREYERARLAKQRESLVAHTYSGQELNLAA